MYHPKSARTNAGFEPTEPPESSSSDGGISGEDAVVDFEVVGNPNGPPEKLRGASPFTVEMNGHHHRRRSSTHNFQLDVDSRRPSSSAGEHNSTVSFRTVYVRIQQSFFASGSFLFDYVFFERNAKITFVNFGRG
jgi:hypothetical protein